MKSQSSHFHRGFHVENRRSVVTSIGCLLVSFLQIFLWKREFKLNIDWKQNAKYERRKLKRKKLREQLRRTLKDCQLNDFLFQLENLSENYDQMFSGIF